MNDLQLLENTLIEIGCKYSLTEVIPDNDEKFGTESYNGEVIYNTKIVLDNGIGFYQSNCIFYFKDGKFQGHGCRE